MTGITDFEQVISFARRFTGAEGTELAFVFSEASADSGIELMNDYPAVRSTVPPEAALPESRAALWYGDRGSGWESVLPVLAAAGFTEYGLAKPNVLQSGVGTSMTVAVWAQKQLVAGYIIATGDTLNQINTDRTTGIALMRTYINESQTNHPLDPTEPFTSNQITAFLNWLNAHNVSATEIANIFDVTPAQLNTWLQNNPRWRFAKQIHERVS